MRVQSWGGGGWWRGYFFIVTTLSLYTQSQVNDKEKKKKYAILAITEVKEIFKELLKYSLGRWGTIVDELLVNTVKMYGGFKEGRCEKGFSSSFIIHHCVLNTLIPLVLTLRVENQITQEEQTGWAHS